jgi:CubicO group peptidase (beta-lactamase class C family)
MKSVHSMMQHAVSEKIFPGGILLVSKSGSVLFHEAYGTANIFTKQLVTHDTVFDLASLTKPLATSLAAMILIQEGKLKLDQKLGTIIPALKNTPKSEIQICHLLSHTSGLPDYRPYYLKICKSPTKLRKETLRKYLAKEPLISSVGEKTIYSDLGFMMLDWLIETFSGCRMDQYIAKKIYQPLGLTGLFFIDLEDDIPEKRYAATEKCPWRQRLMNGMVHDENAFTTGGIAGHAGLFGTAESIHKLLIELLNSYRGVSQKNIFEEKMVRNFLNRKSMAERALGFDVPSKEGSSCGDFFNKEATVGHLGFTGTSFWVDLNQMIIVILLTNRIHPTRNNERIKIFRPELHNAVMKQII